jgi:hypothetical protein
MLWRPSMRKSWANILFDSVYYTVCPVVCVYSGGGALQSVSDTMPDLDVKLLQYVTYNINNIL